MNIDSLLEELNLPKDCINEKAIPERTETAETAETIQTPTQVETTENKKTPYEEIQDIYARLMSSGSSSADVKTSDTPEAPKMELNSANSADTEIIENAEIKVDEPAEWYPGCEPTKAPTQEELNTFVDTPEELKRFFETPPEKISIAQRNQLFEEIEEEKEAERERQEMAKENDREGWHYELEHYIANKKWHGDDFIRAMDFTNADECYEYIRDLKKRGEELGEDTSMIYVKPRIADKDNLPDVDFDYDPHEIIDPNKQLPYEFRTTEKNSRFMWEDYLFRIPFSKNMPKNVYDKIMALEVLKKVVDKANNKMAWSDEKKIYNKLVEDVTGVYDLNVIIERIKKWHYPVKQKLEFKDIRVEGFKYVTIPSGDYEIFNITDAFDNNLPEDVKPRDRKEYNELRELVLNYAQKKAEGYMSPGGMLKLKDLRPITEEDDPYVVRERQWNIELNIEKWEFRCRVIKGEMMSLGEALEKGLPHPLEGIDEKMDQRILEKQRIEEHPTDDTKIIVNDKVCDKVMNSYTGDKIKNPIVDEQANTEYLEDQFIDAYLTYEETVKEAKEEFKIRKNWLKSQGVAVKSVERAVKALRRELKRKPEDKKKEDEVYTRISGRMDMLNRLSGLEAMAV